MSSKRIVIVCVFMLLFSSLHSMVSANHEDFDQAEEDISTLITALEVVHHLLEMGFNSTHSAEPTYSADSMEFHYSQDAIQRAKENSTLALASTLPARRIIDDIDGEVESYLYLNELYLPYHNFTQAKSSFSYQHQGVVLNISSAVDIYLSMEGVDYDLLDRGMRKIEDALFNLARMEHHHEYMEEHILYLNETVADAQELQSQVHGLHELIQRYSDIIEMILEPYSIVPPYLSLIAPDTAHPGQTISCHGSYWNNGFIADEEINIDIQGIGDFTTTTDGYGAYSLDIRMPWDVIGERVINASVSTGHHTMKNITILRYPTNIVLETDKTAYHEETISVTGSFHTDAPVDLSTISLNATHRGYFTPSTSDEISLEYDPSEFSWGTNTIEVLFSGNTSLEASSAQVEFEISIPTYLTIEGAVFEENVSFYGYLYNASSGSTLSNGSVHLQHNGVNYDHVTTDENGSYAFNVTLEDLPTGQHTFNTRYVGREYYRGSVSETLYLLITEDREVLIGTDPLDDDNGEDDNGEDDNGEDDNGEDDNGEDDNGEDDNGEDDNGEDDNGEDDNGEVGNGEDDNGGLLGLPQDGWISVSLLFFVILILILAYFLRKDEVSPDKKQPKKKSTFKKKPFLTKRNGSIEIQDSGDVRSSYGDLIREIDSREILHVPPGRTHREIREDMIRLFGLEFHFDTVTSIFEKATFTDAAIETKELTDYNRSLSKIWEMCFS